MSGQVSEQLLLAEEYCSVALLNGFASMNAEQASVYLIFDMLCWKVTLGDEA
jgi:hypothetical protein